MKAENQKVQFARIDNLNYVSGLTIGVVNHYNAASYEYKPAIENGDHCFWDETLGLIVSIGWEWLNCCFNCRD